MARCARWPRRPVSRLPMRLPRPMVRGPSHAVARGRQEVNGAVAEEDRSNRNLPLLLLSPGSVEEPKSIGMIQGITGRNYYHPVLTARRYCLLWPQLKKK